ncbi:hypothetical protein [Collimonas silvisoli]|uniref:hypothetical protein n=1 Tax=Collimonas silvisoli TaxID=2825884 RepID=UPI001B8AE8A2|nr:hypothetical protein [Collimonas silvisoli]
MTHATPSLPSRDQQVRGESIGYLALNYMDKRLPLQICRSSAGYYIGTADEDGPVSRESIEYFPTRRTAGLALDTGCWQQRPHP